MADRRATDADEQTARARTIELLSVLLIALTAVSTAWSAFEASKWGGVMSIRFSEAAASRTESVRESNLANQQVAVDVSLFSSYADAVAAEDEPLAAFYRQRFPDRLATAVDAWWETDPLVSADAPPSPFAMDAYRLESLERSDELRDVADQRSAAARDANQRSDNYTITSVFYASVLLLGALSTKVESERTQKLLLVIGVLIFIGTTALIATYPVEI